MRSRIGFESIWDNILKKTPSCYSPRKGGDTYIIIKDLHKNKASYTNGLCKMEQTIVKRNNEILKE